MATYRKEHMAVSHEIKSQLAKLLATEDLVVEHKKIKTAQFNVHTRVLTLPMWEKASNSVYDLLVGHEVGHALYTPDEDPPAGIPHQFVNVVEDCRIEKLMKRRYMGLAKTFYRGYQELNEEDFFEIQGEDLTTFNLADKINLNAKVGNFVKIEFSEKEREIVDMVHACETFADVAIAAEALYKFCKQEQEANKKVKDLDQLDNLPPTPPSESPSSMEAPPVSEDLGEEDGESEQSESTEYQNDGQESNSVSSEMDYNETPDVRTADSLENKLEDLVGHGSYENNYVEIPKVNLDTVVIKNSEIHEYIDQWFNLQQEKYTEHDLYEAVDTEFRKFKQTAQKEVSYLVKEFECRKSADSYARATTSRTGVLDTSKLHTYRYNEDLFKKVTTLPDGKNHGLIFVLDWSGSMQYTLKDTCKQLFNLIWFCRKVGIPFDVFAFTGEWKQSEFDRLQEQYTFPDVTPHYEKEEGLLAVHERFSMMNLLTSEMSGKHIEKQLINVWRLACAFSNTWACGYTYPPRVTLSGTPLNEAIISLHQIIPHFQKTHKLQKVHCIVLTDGEANTVPYHVEIQRGPDAEPYMGCRRVNPEGTFLRDRKLGTTYKFSYRYNEFTDVLLTNLRDRFPNTSFIGIRVLEGRDMNRFLNLYFDSTEDDGWIKKEKIQLEWKKTKSFALKNSGYHVYFGLSSSVLSSDSEFDVKEDATKSQIKSAFVKSLKTKKLNKKVLSEFISLVA